MSSAPHPRNSAFSNQTGPPMPSVRPIKSLLAVAAAASLTTVFVASTTYAASDNTRRPVILDSQGGIYDGQGGTMLQTGPLSREPIVGARPIAAPAELAPPESSTPMVVAPYIQVPVGGGSTPPRPQPRPMPRTQ
jgi:hypothetical protein